jgi:DNA primase catalytic core
MTPDQPDPRTPAAAALADRSAIGAARAKQTAERSRARAPTPTTAPTTYDLNKLRDANAEAAAIYRSQLTTARSARRYLLRRTGTDLRNPRWDIGYAPPSRTYLTDHLRAFGFSENDLVTAGLARRSSRGTLIDVFRDRITFALHDLDGHILGFIGRAAPRAANTQRYLNTAQTPLFHKGKGLFGLWEQLPQIHATNRPLALVEGVFDTLAIHTTSDPDTGPIAIAPSGTALTRDHADLITHAAGPDRPIILAFDADPAGRQAAARAWTTLGGDIPPATGRHPRPMTYLQLPPATDPAQILHDHGPQALRRLLTNPAHQQPLVDLVLDHRLEPWHDRLDFLEHRITAARAVAPLIAAHPPADVSRLVIRTAARVGLDHSTVTRLVTDAVTTEPVADAVPASAVRRRTTPPGARSDAFASDALVEVAPPDPSDRQAARGRPIPGPAAGPSRLMSR